VLRASQQPGGLHSPGKLEGNGMRKMPSCTQIVLVEHGREGSRGFNTSRECNGGEWKASREVRDKEENEDRDEHIPKGR